MRWRLGLAFSSWWRIVADPVIAPAPVIPVTEASWISPFNLMAKAEDLAAETFAAI
jgi:hypothetical protein